MGLLTRSATIGDQSARGATLELSNIAFSNPTALHLVATILQDHSLRIWYTVSPLLDILFHPQVLSNPEVVMGFLGGAVDSRVGVGLSWFGDFAQDA